MSTKHIVFSSAAAAVLVIAVAWWAVLRTGSFEARPARGVETPAPAAPSPARESASSVVAIPDPAAVAAASRPGFVPSPASVALREEIRLAPDLRALYERTKNDPDPSGERSYRMAEAIFECSAFIDLPMDKLGRKLAVSDAAANNARRTQVLAAVAERCKGFAGMGAALGEITAQLHQRALAAGYPAEVARSLRFEPATRDPEHSDKVAIDLLSNKPDADVLLEIREFLRLRNRGVAQRQDDMTQTVAWGLLQCSYGADCGPESRPVTMTCILFGACNLVRVEEAVRVQGATQATINNASAMRDQLAAAIANRDWARVGFIPRNTPQ